MRAALLAAEWVDVDRREWSGWSARAGTRPVGLMIQLLLVALASGLLFNCLE